MLAICDFGAAISEPKTPSFCGISGDLAPSTRKSLAIAIVRFWCAKYIFVAWSIFGTIFAHADLNLGLSAPRSQRYDCECECEFWRAPNIRCECLQFAPNLKEKAANWALRRNSLANVNGFANAIAKISSSMRKCLANGRLRQNSLAMAHAMAWCTQISACDKLLRVLSWLSYVASAPSTWQQLQLTHTHTHLNHDPMQKICTALLLSQQFNSWQPGALQREVNLQGVFVKLGGLTKLKGSCKAHLRKSPPSPRKSPGK